MMRRLALLLCLLVLASACGNAEQSAPLSRRAQPIGEPTDGYPSYPERVVLYLTNRARTEPEAFNAQEPYEPTPPLRFDADLAKAARWQARHIIEQSCWCEDHSSCCDMQAADEGGQCAGASGTCGATGPSERVGYWSAQYTGENAAKGYQSAQAAVDGWIHSSGHWANINNGGHDLLGPGNFQTGWVQDFGAASQPPPVAADGIHFGSQTNQTFGITYYQPDTGGPQTILAIVDGECHELDLAYGQPDHGAFEATLSLDPGCHRYYFHVTDGDGAEHVYPSQGSLGAAVGQTDDCPLFSGNRPADTCSPSGQSCETGQTRPCYTGPWGTEGVGICQSGTERCIGGQWTGECRLETVAAGAEICDNGLDDDCNGQIDDGCAAGSDAGPADAGSSTSGHSSSGGCTLAGSTPTGSALPWLALGGVCFALGWRRRRAPSGR